MMTSQRSAQENASEFFPMIRVTHTIVLDDREITERFVRAADPGARMSTRSRSRSSCASISRGHRCRPM